MPKPARDQVFISYSHKDRKWFEKLKTMLKPMVRKKIVSVWDDTKMEGGVKWKVEIEGALAAAKVAVLLVSPDFLASDFIAERELPSLLNAAEKGGLVILWVYVSSCLYDETEIGDYQSAHSISKPLDYLRPNLQNSVLADVCRKIRSASGSSISGRRPGIKSPRPQEGVLPLPPARDIAAANAGDSTAMFDLGWWYEERKHQDYDKAREWYQKAARAGHKGAMVNVGTLYEEGLGGDRNYGKARECYKKAARVGDKDAMFNLGTLYDEGIGVIQDYSKAREWYKKAAQAGEKKAKKELSKLSQLKAIIKERAISDSTGDVRQAAVQEIARGWKEDPDALPWLKERAASDENSDVRQAAIQELGRIRH